MLDSGQAVPPAAVREHEMPRLRLERLRRARAEGRALNADIVDTLTRGAVLSEIDDARAEEAAHRLRLQSMH